MTVINHYLTKIKWEDILLDLTSKIISLLLLILLFFIAKKVLTSIVDKTIKHSLALTKQSKARQKTLIKLIQNILNYGLYFLLIYWILTILGLPVSSLLAGAGLAGVAIGLGAQGFLSDVVNGFFILLENQYDVGDIVNIETVSGHVSSVGIRTTQIRDFDGSLHTIPNRQIILVTNKSRGNMRAQIDLPIYAHSDLAKIKGIIQNINLTWKNYPQITQEPNILGIKTLPNGQVVYRIDIFTTNGQQHDIQSHFFQTYQEALLKENIPLVTINSSQPYQKN